MFYTLPVTTLPAYIAVPCELAQSISVGAVSDTIGAQLDFEITFLDGAGNDVGDIPPNTLVCGALPNWPITSPPTLYRGLPQANPDPSFHVAGVTAIISVSRVTPKATGGVVNWTLAVHVSFPIGALRTQ